MDSSTGKYIILIGAAIMIVGLIVYFFGDKLSWPSLDWPGLDWPGLDWPGLDWPGLDWLGRLPGDIRIGGKNGGGFYFPIVTCIVVSILLNLVIVLIRRFFGS